MSWDTILGFVCGGICVAVIGVIALWLWIYKAFERF